MSIGERLRDLRQRHGYSLRRLADEAGLDRGNLSRMERDRSSLWPAYAERLRAVLGPEVDMLRRPAGIRASLDWRGATRRRIADALETAVLSGAGWEAWEVPTMDSQPCILLVRDCMS